MIASVPVLIVIFMVTYLAAAFFAPRLADQLLFLEFPPSYVADDSLFFLEAEDGERIAAAYLPVEGSNSLLIYCHGNGEDLGHAREFLRIFQRAGVASLVFDYPGYGLSSGMPSEAGCNAAVDASYRYATETLGYQPEQIILYGRSLGSGPACWLAEKQPVGGVILDGAFTSAFRVKTGIKVFPTDRFDNLSRLADIDAPFLVIHGTMDEVIPFSHAEKNFESILSSKENLWVEGAAHNNLIEQAGADYWNAVLGFIKNPQPQTP